MTSSSWRAHLGPNAPHPPTGVVPQFRLAVRCLLIDQHERVLLQQVTDPGDGAVFWIAPGGGVESDESDLDALRRELREETGITEIVPGPAVWTRQHVFPFNGRWYHQQETFYLGRYVDHEHAAPELEELELGIILGHRWWTLPELDRTADTIAPERLPGGVRSIVRQGPPAEPYDIGI